MKLGKYDPPNKEEMLKNNPGASTLGDLLRPYREIRKPLDYEDLAKMENLNISNQEDDASRARRKKGRKRVLTPEKIRLICKTIEEGATEKASRIKAGVSGAVFYEAKRTDVAFQQVLAEAHQRWTDLRFRRHQAALYASQSMRAAGLKAKRPTPTQQAGLVHWHLTFNVPLYFAAITREQEDEACKRFGYCLDQWDRQKEAFGLMQKIYRKRAKLRGENPQAMAPKSVYETSPQPMAWNSKIENSYGFTADGKFCLGI